MSRNQREGKYLGRYRSVWDDLPEGERSKRRNHRKGNSMWFPLSLRRSDRDLAPLLKFHK